jgi:hypothetical protein
LVALRSAPFDASSSITAGRFEAAAYINGVCARTPSLALTSAPFSISTRTASSSPEAAATISGVVPFGVPAFTSLPALIKA